MLALSLGLASPSVRGQSRHSAAGAARGGAGGGATGAPRLLTPGSAGYVAGRRPTFRWTTPRGAGPFTWQVCRDRGCGDVVASARVSGGSTWPASDLPAGMLFWRVAAADGTASAVWSLVVPPRGASDGTGWGRVTDVNGDGFADVLRLAPPGGADQRRAFVHPGSLQGPSAQRVAVGGTAGLVSDAGDVNGDGFSDVAVAPPGSSLAARTVAIHPGGPNGASASPSNALRLALPRGGPILSVAGAGDVNGDGYGDVLVVQGTQAGGGDDRVMLFYGGAAGVRASTLVTASTNGAAPMPGESFAAPLGDANGDGFADVAVRTVVNDGRYTGAVAVYLGDGDGAASAPAATVLPGQADEAETTSFGQGIVGGFDANGDGYPELAVGSASCVWVFAGSPRGPVMPAVFSRCSQPSPTGDLSNPALSGRRMAAGDFTGDGFGDLLVGDEGAGPDASGYAYVFAGSAQGLSMEPVARLESGDSDAAEFGYGAGGYRAPGDVNCDGYADVVALSSGYSPVELFTGRTPSAVFLGGARGPGPTPAVWLR